MQVPIDANPLRIELPLNRIIDETDIEIEIFAKTVAPTRCDGAGGLPRSKPFAKRTPDTHVPTLTRITDVGTKPYHLESLAIIRIWVWIVREAHSHIQTPTGQRDEGEIAFNRFILPFIERVEFGKIGAQLRPKLENAVRRLTPLRLNLNIRVKIVGERFPFIEIGARPERIKVLVLIHRRLIIKRQRGLHLVTQFAHTRDEIDIIDAEERVRGRAAETIDTAHNVAVFLLVLVVPYHIRIEIHVYE